MAFGKLQLRTFRDFAQGMVVYRSGRPPTRDIFETEEFSVRVVRLDVSEFSTFYYQDYSNHSDY